MSNRGKEVLTGPLLYRRESGSTKKRVTVTAYCSTNGKYAIAQPWMAQLTLNDYGQKPKSVIPLEGAKIDCGGSAYPSLSRMSASPSPSPHGSLGGSGSGIVVGSGGTILSGGSMCAFTVITQNGEMHEFMTESENDRLRWVKLLTLLVMFPYSTIPDEPKNMLSIHCRSMDPEKYQADSVWLVYILPEEVGMQCHIIGINVIALKSDVKDIPFGHLQIYNAADPSTPLISWDRDKIRRTGKTGNLVFIEIGRRCQGGPGLLWMYSCSVAQALRETLHNFLFEGDGRAVAIPTQGTQICDVPRSSPSYKHHNSIPGYNNHVLSRSKSHYHDSGYPGSPASSMNTPPQLNGPPVRLDKHPSIRRKRPDISRSSSTASFGSYSDRDMPQPITQSGESVDPGLGRDGSGESSRSSSPQDKVANVMDPDQPTNGNGASNYDSVPNSNGGSVAIPTQGTQIYDVPRSSPSYKHHNSIPGYNNHVLSRSKSHYHDFGYPGSPASSMSTPPQLNGPPVRLDKHPSIQRKRPDISRSSSTTSFGSYSDRDMPQPITQSELVDPGLGRDGSGESPMDPDQPTNGNGASNYDLVPRRPNSNVNGLPTMQQRIVLNGGGQTPSHYEQMIHPRNSMTEFDGYVSMKPAEGSSHATSAPIPVAHRNDSHTPSDDTYHHLQRRPSPQHSSSPRSRSNYDQPPMISEGKRLYPDAGPTNYDNHPLPRDLKGVSVEYKPNYQSVEMAQRWRRGSMNQDKYENIDGERSTSPNSNTNNAGDQKRRFSLRRRSSEKESVRLPVENGVPSPVKNGSSDIESYVVIQPSVEYSSIDCQSSEVIGTMKSQRQQQDSHYHRPQVVLK